MKKLLMLGLALAVIGCGSGTDPADTTTTTEMTTSTLTPSTTLGEPTTTVTAPETTLGSSTTLASTTTTTRPQTTTTAMTEVTISPAGFWEVRIGETVAENEAKIGFRFDELGGDPNHCMILQLREVGGIYFIASTLTGDPVDGRENLVLGRVSTESPGWMTENGIEVGMSVAEAGASLGDTITSREPHFYVEGGEYIVVGPEDARYIFETDGEAITAIHAGLEPIVSYAEACS
ncbi:MAG: hypothetical protein ACRDVD_07095 [Acidimicrobiia bacterium]